MLTPYPDATLHNPDPGYFRRLLRACGFTYADAAEALKCDERTVGRYACGHSQFDYSTQFTLECFVAKRISEAAKEDKLSSTNPQKQASLVPKNAELRPTGTDNPRKSAQG